MVATLSKIGEGAFADVFGCQGDDWTKFALKVHTCSSSVSAMTVLPSSLSPCLRLFQ